MWFEMSSSKTSLNGPLYHERIYPNILSKRDSSTSVADEEIADVDETFSSKVVIQEHSSFQFEGVRFTPKVIEFSDAFEGKQFFQKIKLQNVGKNPVLVKIGEPSSFVLHMNKHDRCAKLLPSGKCITRILSYVYHNDHLVQRSQIRVQINGRSIDYPIIVRKAVPLIEVNPQELDFKVINMGASAKTLKITITNAGGRGTKFAIDLGRNELDLVVNPPRGTIRAKNQMNVYVEMVGLTEGEFYKEMWITTNERPIRVPIIAEVMRPRLEVYHPNATGDFTLINFPPTFYGTQRLDSIVLRNFSADVTPFVIFAETSGELKSCRDARKQQTSFQMFVMSSEDGRLEPFESRIVTITFKPLRIPVAEGWHHKKAEEYKKSLSNEILVFFRINRVHCVEKQELGKSDPDQKTDALIMSQKEADKKQSIMMTVASAMTLPVFGLNTLESGAKNAYLEEKLFSDSALPVPLEDKDVVRLCLHGEACEPDLLIQPKTLYFQNVYMGKTETKVLQLTNVSLIEMKYTFHKTVNIRTSPGEGWLKSREAVDIEVLYTPTFQGKVKNAIKIEIFGKSAVLSEDDPCLVSLKVLKVNFSSTVSMCVPPRQPKIGLGISPQLTNEVGLLSDLVTYGSAHPKPYNAVLGALHGKTKRKWMVKENDKKNNFDNALIAFPNDRPEGYQSWPANKVCRTIFTGNFRYSPPADLRYALSPEEECRKSKSHRIWNEYLRRMSEFRSSKKVDDSSSDELPCGELFDARKLNKFESAVERFDQFRCLKKKEIFFPKFALIPLSPVFLCNIKVEPKLIDFAMVAPNSSASEILKLHNMNPFPVSVRFVPGKSGVTLPDGDTRIVPPLTKKLLQIVFKTKDFGRYNGFLDYVINGSHQFKITVSANVVSKTLVICESDQNIDFGNFSSSAAFQPNTKCITLINNLRSPIKYHWEMHSDSAFYIEPLNGEVPPMVSLMNHIYFSLHPEKSYFAEANLVSESGTVQQVKLNYRKYKTNVYFLTNKIELKEIPLNLVEIVKPTLKNVNYYDVAFEIVDFSTVPGIRIYPRQGIIKARCTFDLEVEFQIPVIIDFQFDIKVRVQQGPVLSLKVCGSVVCPLVRIVPMEVTMKRISAQSFNITSMCLENYGTTPAHVVINLKEYPEYRISRRKDKIRDDLEEEGILLPPQKSFRFFLHFEPNDVARYQFYLPIVINGILGPPMMQDSASENFSNYLEPLESSYGGYGVLTRSADLKTKMPCACVNCTVTGRLLKISTLDIVFQEMISSCKEDNFTITDTCENVISFVAGICCYGVLYCTYNYQNEHSLIQEEEELEITNLHVLPLTICIRTDDVNNKHTPFKLEVVGKKVEHHSKSIKIHLQVGETVTLKTEFEPVKAGEYTIEIPIFVKGYNEGYAYNFIKLSGELKKATISAEIREINFPPVPLRVGTEVIIQVFAERYHSPEVINCSVWEVEEYGKGVTEAVKVVWLDEPKITGTHEFQSFLIQVSFQSSITISLRTFLIFWDSRGEYFPVLLTAISDNCTITNHIFLSTQHNKYKLVRDETDEKAADEEPPYYNIKSAAKTKIIDNIYRRVQDKKHKMKSNNSTRSNPTVQYAPAVKIDRGPKLVIQMTKSMQRITQLNFVALKKSYEYRKKESNFISSHSTSIISHTDLLSDSTKSSLKTGKGMSDITTDVIYPLFPSNEDTYYDKYLNETLRYVEQWVFEVAFHCQEYMKIPTDFQMAVTDDDLCQGGRIKELKNDAPKKTVIDLVAELAGPKVRQFFPDKPPPLKDSSNRVEYLYNVFYCLLHFLNIQGSFLPHVRPENLLCYEDYVAFSTKHPACDTPKCEAGFPVTNPYRRISSSITSGSSKAAVNEGFFTGLGQDLSIGTLNEAWHKSLTEENYDDDLFSMRDRKNVEIDESVVNGGTTTPVGRRGQSFDYGTLKDIVFRVEMMDEKTFNSRSTQAWLDVVLQIFRTLVLPKIVFRKLNPTAGLPEVEDKFSVETLSSSSYSVHDVPKGNRAESMTNIDINDNNNYTVQERILLSWLNHHYDVQRSLLWLNSSQSDKGKTPPPRKVDSFRTDLSDSLVLIAVTASHCPYLVPNYFVDVFPCPANQEQIYHNAIKLTSAWREVNISLTVEPKDIIQSNAVFMLMIVCHLYEILPVLCPRSLIRFSAPLTEEMVRMIELINKIDEKITYEAKFIGDQEDSFRLINSPTINLKSNKRTELKIAFRARRIHKVSVTLLLDGASVSPNFAKSIVFHLEGEPSELTEFTTIKLQGSLYKVICLDIPITPPYREPATYEISYSTSMANDFETKLNGMKPWREIWNRKASRRLFLNQSYLYYDGESPAVLNVTIACLTPDTRNFWLLFRSEVGDFIVRIDVAAKIRDKICGPITTALPKSWSKSAICTCLDVKTNLSGSNISYCPLFCYLRVPARNDDLWNTMFVMFQKTLDSKEKVFWKHHFETNIGIRLIKWLFSQDESPEVIDEFIPSLRTSVTYSLKLDSNAEKYITVVPSLEISDVRSKDFVYLPIHISNDAPSDLKVTLTMTSESKTEIRLLKYVFQKTDEVGEDTASKIDSQKISKTRLKTSKSLM